MIHHLQVAILGSQQLFTEGLCRLIRDISFVAGVCNCSSYAQLKQELTCRQPKVLFLHYNLHDANNSGFTICTLLKQQHPALHIALLTDYDNKRIQFKARQSGANACFTKNTTLQVLEQFLASVQPDKNEPVIYSHETSDTAKSILPVPGGQLVALLTARENEIFKLLATCNHNKAIQQKLHISYDTLRTHRDNILRKLELENAGQIVQFAYRHNLVD